MLQSFLGKRHREDSEPDSDLEDDLVSEMSGYSSTLTIGTKKRKSDKSFQKSYDKNESNPIS